MVSAQLRTVSRYIGHSAYNTQDYEHTRDWMKEILRYSRSTVTLENEKFFELKSKEYRDGIKRKETR